MMRRFLLLVISLLSGLWVSATWARGQSAGDTTAGDTTVDESFYISDLTVRGAPRGVQFALQIAASEDGKMVLCGALSVTGSQRRKAKSVSDAMQLYVDGKRAVTSLAWMPVVPASEGLIGARAKCMTYHRVNLHMQSGFSLNLSKRDFSN